MTTPNATCSHPSYEPCLTCATDTAADYWICANDPANGLDPETRSQLFPAIANWLTWRLRCMASWDLARERTPTLDLQETTR